jgi:myo-inositol-1(or 4)-monophosphatase
MLCQCAAVGQNGAMTDSLPEGARAFLLELAPRAAAIALPYFRHPLRVEDKGTTHFDPVTAADREVEALLREAISVRFPDHAIMGEEFGNKAGNGDWQWVIDPIDGTRAFISGIPTWATLIGLCAGDIPVLGLMSQPFTGEVFVGCSAGSEWRQGDECRALATRATATLGEASLFATTPDMFSRPLEWEAFERVSARVRLTRFGADAYAYCMLAAGQIDLVIEAGLGFYDIAALVPIIEGAGGVVTDWTGAPVRQGGRVIAAANPVLHASALALLNG